MKKMGDVAAAAAVDLIDQNFLSLFCSNELI